MLSIVLLFVLLSCEQQAQSASAQNDPVTTPEEEALPPPSWEGMGFTPAYLMGKFDPATDSNFVKIPVQYANTATRYLRKEALEAFIRMHDAARADGIKLTIVSATRNFAAQKSIWEAKWEGRRLVEGANISNTIPDPAERALKILEYSSMPGTSRHHWGTDIDINSLNSNYFKKSPGKEVHTWLSAHAAAFGYCQTYSPKCRATVRVTMKKNGTGPTCRWPSHLQIMHGKSCGIPRSADLRDRKPPVDQSRRQLRFRHQPDLFAVAQVANFITFGLFLSQNQCMNFIKVLLLAAAFCHLGTASAQRYMANVDEGYRFSYTKLDHPPSISWRNTTQNQLDSFPLGFPADPNFKNFRNVTLADINKDGLTEIITGIRNNLYVYQADSLLWSLPIEGLAIYPPSVADINNDGRQEIVQVTGGANEKGRIYVVDQNGSVIEPWPLGFDDNWILTAPALSDLDGDQVMEIIVNERDSPSGKVRILKLDGTSFNSNWPVFLDGTPAVTPSVGDIDQDGEKDIVVFSTTAQFAFDLEGNLKEGWGLDTDPFQKYSFQSPILVNLDQDPELEIVGAAHGNAPQFYVLEHDGTFAPNWPVNVPEQSWTFSTPTVVSLNGAPAIFMSRPIFEGSKSVVFSWTPDAVNREGFPIVKMGGLEGLISIADVDDDDEFELVFGSQMVDENGLGFIHAYEMDGTTQVPGFPLQTRGWTFMNGVNIGDINNNGLMDLVALSNTVEAISGLPDSAYVNVFELPVRYSPSKVLWSTYKGSNSRDGLLEGDFVSSVSKDAPTEELAIEIFPNPTNGAFVIRLRNPSPKLRGMRFRLNNTMGQTIREWVPEGVYTQLETAGIPEGVYWLTVSVEAQILQTKKLIKIR